MNGLFYLLFCSLKNNLRETIRKPARLLMYLAVIFLIGMMLVVNAFMTRDPAAEFKDIHLLGGMFFALMTTLLIFALARAFKSGGSLFQMSDVNLLFVSPVAPQKILIYGVVQVIKTALMAGLFILFQSVTLGEMFGAGFSVLLIIIGIFALCFCLSEIIAILIYSVTNGNPARKRITKAIITLVFLPFAADAVAAFIREGDSMTALLYVCKSSVLQMTPVSGWGAAALLAFLKGQWLAGGLFLALTMAAITGLLILLFRLKSDYYEDVLVATESVFEKKRAIMEGNLGLATAPERKIQVAKTGISGLGARAIFGKHMRETFRDSRFGFIDTRTLFCVVAAIVAAIAFTKLGDSSNRLLIILQYFAWFQVFAIGMGPSLRELYTHYLYLLPDPPFEKLFWNSLAVVLKSSVDSILVLGIAGVILRENPLIIGGAILASSMFALLLVGINILSLRWTSTNLSTGILVVVYLFAVMIVIAPGLIAAVVAAVVIGGETGIIVALVVVSIWEFFVSVLCFALSKSILDNCDMPVFKGELGIRN